MLTKDIQFMKRALALAKKGIGTVSPNPLVGAVLVKDGIIIGEGYHEKYGEAHAEVNAINSATDSPEGATLYCTLEPCCHTNKQTPPCSNLVISSKIKRVVICNLDPNPYVAGKGVKQLEEAGIEVVSGVLKSEGLKVNEVFFKYITTSMPFINIKYAQTLDGKIAVNSGDSKWISDESARTKVHEMRLKYDAVLIGRNTLNKDNAKLNIRMGIDSKGKVPYRVIIGSLRNLNQDADILNDEFTDKTVIITSIEDYQKADNDFVKKITDKKIKMVFASIREDRIDLEEAFKKLGEMKITSILVEGGAKVISTLLKEELYDKISCFICPKLAGNGPSYYENSEINEMSNAIKLQDVSYEVINDQVLMTAYRTSKKDL